MRYEVTGASREDGRDVVRVYEAADEEQAMRMANADGIVVDGVDLLIDFGPAMTSSPADWSSRHNAGGSPRPAPREPAMSTAPPPQQPAAKPQPLAPPPPVPHAVPQQPRVASPQVASGDIAFPQAPAVAPTPASRPSAPPAVEYHVPSEKDAPPAGDYRGLQIASKVLFIFAVLSYGIATLTLVATFVGMAALASFAAASFNAPARTPGAGEMAANVLAWIALFSPSIAFFFAGAVAHGLSAACVALRDIARNSWR